MVMPDRYFGIELCTQICTQIIENNQKVNAQAIRTKNASSLAEELLLRCEQALEATVHSLLEHKDIDQNDPFN